MSNIDKQALREATEKALSAGDGNWQTWREAGMNYPQIFTSSGHIVTTVNGSFSVVRSDFIAAANPATVLGLLDELEAKDKRIAELEAREVKLPNPHAHLIWIQAGHAPDDYWDDVAVSHSEKDKCCDGSDRYPVYTLWEIKEALSAIGINIAAAGKGE
ncbi:ead/Ea22-like family protein [Enterobacter hormaechei]|uniref:ead/Ea22-like family protein n=1 Tax=Enterobacter hormaechei TaxID=158836 RepID=UPI0034CE3299